MVLELNQNIRLSELNLHKGFALAIWDFEPFMTTNSNLLHHSFILRKVSIAIFQRQQLIVH
jgi:hypothetical protein